MQNVPGTAREFRDIFQLGGVPAFQQFYFDGMFVWKMLYRGLYKPWHWVHAPTIANPACMRWMDISNIPKALCAEMASLVFGDAPEINVTRMGWSGEEPDPLGLYVQRVLRENGFGTKMQELTEQALALGGAALKVWYEPERDGRPGGVRVGYCMADQFIPTAWDNAKVTEGVFISRIEGSPTGVIGFPLSMVGKLLMDAGFDLPLRSDGKLDVGTAVGCDGGKIGSSDHIGKKRTGIYAHICAEYGKRERMVDRGRKHSGDHTVSKLL